VIKVGMKAFRQSINVHYTKSTSFVDITGPYESYRFYTFGSSNGGSGTLALCFCSIFNSFNNNNYCTYK